MGPGIVLATVKYAPVSLATYSVATTTITALDTTNLTLSLTVPANGIVDFEVSLSFDLIRTTTTSQLYVALLNHTGGAVITDPVSIAINQTSTTTLSATNLLKFHATGLAPGALQVDLAAGVDERHGYERRDLCPRQLLHHGRERLPGGLL